MARINVDDDIESRPEWRKLVKLLNGNDREALGLLVSFWRHAQNLWGEHKLVPKEDVAAFDFQPLIESRWAVVRDDGVYAIGAEERFAWYRQKCDAGRARSDGARDESGKFASGQPADSQRTASIAGRPIQPLVPSLSPSPVLVKKKEGKKRELPATHPLESIWNQNRGALPQARGMGNTRRRLAEARWAEQPNTEYWTEIVSRMARSSFCRGEKNKDGVHKNWKADIDFLLRPDTHIRVMEGKYDDEGVAQQVENAKLAEIDAYMKAQGFDVA